MENLANLDLPTDGYKPKSRMESLKDRAAQLGINHHKNISEKALADRINAHLEGGNTQEDNSPSYEEDEGLPKAKSIGELRIESQLLIRCKVHVLDPQRKNRAGDIITVGNGKIGFTTKYIPWGSAYHVPKIIHDALKEMVYLEHYDQDVNGTKVTMHREAPAFIIEELPPLTPEQLQTIAARQSGGTL